jgi:hypothetical protein
MPACFTCQALMRTPSAGDRTCLVLAEYDQGDPTPEGWRLQDARLPEGRARTTTPRPL